MVALEVITELIVIYDKITYQIQAFQVKFQRVHQCSKAILRIKIKDYVLVFLSQDFFELLGVFRLDRMLTVSWHFSLVSSISLAS